MIRNRRHKWLIAGIALLLVFLLSGIGYVQLMQDNQDALVALPTVAQMPTSDAAHDDNDATSGQSTDAIRDEVGVLPTDEDEAVVANSDTPANIGAQGIPQPDTTRLVLRFDPTSTEIDRLAYVNSLGATIVRTIEPLASVVVQLPQDTDSTTTTIPSSDIVTSSEPEQYVTALSDVTAPTNDPLFTDQWALTDLAIADVWNNLPENLPETTVALIDSGICAGHPDLSGRVLAGYDFVDDDTTPDDIYNHGCGVAGIIAANANNATGIAGIAPNANIMPLKVLNGNGIGTYSDVAGAIVYAVDNGAEIINLSLGGTAPSSILEDAIAYAEAQGVVMVAAAGNNGGSTPMYPAAYPQVISVGATNETGDLATFSNRNSDTTAPGDAILTLSTDGTYETKTGTSYAAAHITALLALDSFDLDADTTGNTSEPETTQIAPTAVPSEDLADSADDNGDLPYIQVGDMRIPVADVSALSAWQPNKWLYGVVPFEIADSIKNRSNYSTTRQQLLDAMQAWEEVAGVTFVERDTMPTILQNSLRYVRITDTYNGCWSYVGQVIQNFNTNYQEMNLQYQACWFQSTIQHELGHVLGFIHEHQRPDRDNFVTIDEQYVEEGQIHNFDNTYGGNVDATDEYDFLSIMHYSQWAFSRCAPWNYYYTTNQAVCGGTTQPSIVANPGYEQYQTSMGSSASLTALDAEGMYEAYPCSYTVGDAGLGIDGSAAADNLSDGDFLEFAGYLVSEALPAHSACDTITFTLFPGEVYLIDENFAGINSLFELSASDVTLDVFGFTGTATVERDSSAPNMRFFYAPSGRTITIEDITFENGTVTGTDNVYGGAIYSNGADLSLTNVGFDNNSATATAYNGRSRGGAIYGANGGRSTITDVDFTNNSADFGGALFITDHEVFMNDADFTNNSATVFGGAIDARLVDSGPPPLQGFNTTFTNNTTATMANEPLGGAIHAETLSGQRASVYFENTTFDSNLSDLGGAAHFSNIYVEFWSSVFLNNVATFYGGAISASTDSQVLIALSRMQNNEAMYGGAVFTYDSRLSIVNTDLESNTAMADGGAVGVNTSTGAADMLLDNARFVNNVALYGSAVMSEDGGIINMSCFVGNSGFAIELYDDLNNATLDAQNNWWGTSAGAANGGNGIWSDMIGPYIDASNPLTTAPQNCPSTTVPTQNTITGTVIEEGTNTPLISLPVVAYAANGSGWSAETCTNQLGQYGIDNVPQNVELLVRASGTATLDCGGAEQYYREYWQDEYDENLATRLTLTAANNNITNVDFRLFTEPFTLNVDSDSITVNEGSQATNSGTFLNPEPQNAVSLYASVGRVVDNLDGTWSWTYTPDDGPAESQTVTIRLEDSGGVERSTITFELTVNNVPPTGTLATSGAYTPDTLIEVTFDNITDASSADANVVYDIDCDTDGSNEFVDVAHDAAAPTCTYAGTGAYTITGILRDKDGGEYTDTLDVVIAENNPPNVLSIVAGNSTTDVALTVAGAPNEDYALAVYSAESCTTNTQTLLDTQTVTLDNTGLYSGAVTFNATLAADRHLLLTAQRLSTGDTSVFSACSLLPPTSLNATVDTVSYDLTWQNPDSDLTSIQVEVQADGTTAWVAAQTLGAVTTTTLNGYMCEMTTHIRLRAVDDTGRVSPYSSVFTATTADCPPNDALASAETVTGTAFSDIQNTIGARTEAEDPTPVCGIGVSNSVWYQFTPPVSGSYQLHTIGSDHDVMLAVYTGNSNNLSVIGCDKDSAPGNHALLTMPLNAGTTYSILLGAANGQGGNVTFAVEAQAQVTPTPVPTNIPPPTSVPTPVLTTVGLYDDASGTWLFRDNNTTGTADVAVNWRIRDGAVWTPLVGDWDGDSIDGIGFYSNGVWLLRNVTTVGDDYREVRFGTGETDWQPIVGDWNGDSIDDFGLYRDGIFMLSYGPDGDSTDLMFTFNPLGTGGTPIAGDWDNSDGDTVGLYNAGQWILAGANSTNNTPIIFRYGEADWLPVIGDWNQDGVDTVGGFRNGRWYLRNSNSAGAPDTAFAFGGAGMPLSSYRGGAPAIQMMSANIMPPPTDVPTLVPAATQIPSETPLPTNTQVPTITPSPTVPPTATPEPELTPEATAEP